MRQNGFDSVDVVSLTSRSSDSIVVMTSLVDVPSLLGKGPSDNELDLRLSSRGALLLFNDDKLYLCGPSHYGELLSPFITCFLLILHCIPRYLGLPLFIASFCCNLSCRVSNDFLFGPGSIKRPDDAKYTYFVSYGDWACTSFQKWCLQRLHFIHGFTA